MSTITVVVEARTGSFETDMNRAAKAAEKRAHEMQKAFVGLGKVIGTGIGVGISALGVLVKKQIDAADEASKLAQKTGLSTEALSQLQYAAGLSGIEDLGGSLTKFNRSIAEAAQGSAAQADAFKALGINIRNTDGTLKDTETLFGEAATAISRLGNGAEKTAYAVALFGKSGTDLIPLLNEGAKGIAAMRKEADELGLTIDERMGKAAEGFNDNLDRLGKVATGVSTRLASELAPELERITGLMVDTAKEAGAVSRAADGISIVFRLAAAAAITVANAVQISIKSYVGLSAVLNQLSSFNFRGAMSAGQAAFDDIGEDINDITQAYSRLFGTVEEGKKKAGKNGTGPDGLVDAAAAKAASKSAAEAQKEAEAALKELLDAEERQRDSINAIIDALKEESATMGATNAQIKERALVKLEADAIDRESARTLANYIDLQKKSAEIDRAKRADTIALEASERAYQRTIADFGKGPMARRFSGGQNEIDDDFRNRVQDLQADSAAGLLPGGIYETELARLQKFHQDASQQWLEYFSKIEQRNSESSAGFQESLQSYLDGARNLGSQLGDGLLNVLDSTGSAISDLTARFIIFGEGGKEAIRGLAQQVSQGLLTSLIDVGIQYVKNALIQRAVTTTTTAASIAATQANATAQVAANSSIAASAAPAAALTSLASFGGNSFPALAGIAVVSAAIGALLGGAFADGGDPPVGKISLVGERGPELFIPRTAGTIIPNGGISQTGGAAPGANSAGGTTIINNAPGITITPRAGRVYIDMLPEWLEMAVEYARDAIGADLGNADSDIGRTLNGRIGAPAGAF